VEVVLDMRSSVDYVLFFFYFSVYVAYLFVLFVFIDVVVKSVRQRRALPSKCPGTATEDGAAEELANGSQGVFS